MPSQEEEIIGDEDSSDEDDEEVKEDAKKEEKTKEEAKPPQANPFGDDSEDDSSDGGEKKKKQAEPEKKKEEKDPFAEEGDSDDNDDDNEKKKKESEKKDKTNDSSDDDDEDIGGSPTKTKTKKDSPEKKKSGNDDDDLEDSDDDDDDNEFAGDDIAGTSHAKGFQKKKTSQKSALDRLRELEEAEAERIGADDEVELQSPKQPTAPKIDPRTMVVLEPTRPPEDTTLHVTKLPNLVGIQPDAFDPATYSARAEEEEYGHVLDMMRWRYKKDKDGQMMRDEQNGKLIRESNARLIQWEDGSYTLHVGKEALQVDSVDSSKKMGQMNVLTGRTATFAGLNGYLYLSQMATNREPNDEEEKEGDDTDKPEKETPAGTVLECMGSVGSRMTARPSSLASEAHKSLTVAVRQRTMKRAKIAQVITQLDPEKEKEKKIQQKMQFEKEQARKKNYGDGYSSRARSSRPRMTSRYMEDDGDYDTIGLGSLKKRTMNSDEEDFDDYADEMDDDDEEEETFNRKRPKKRAGASNRKSLDSDDDDDDDDAAAADGGKDESDDDQEEDDEVITPVKSSKKRTHQAVFDDDDSDD